MTTSNNETTNNELNLFDRVCLVLFALVCFIFIAGCVAGHVKQEQNKAICNEWITVGYTKDSMTERLVAPWHGGTVYTMYTHYRDYEWEVDGQKCSFTLYKDSRSNANDLPTMVRVSYDPVNPTHYWVWKLDESERWYCNIVFRNEDGKIDYEVLR